MPYARNRNRGYTAIRDSSYCPSPGSQIVQLISGQRKRDINTTRAGLWIFTPSGGDDYELAALHFVRRGRGVSREGERGFQKKFAGGLVVGAKLLIVVCCAEKKKSARRYDGAAVILGARV